VRQEWPLPFVILSGSEGSLRVNDMGGNQWTDPALPGALWAEVDDLTGTLCRDADPVTTSLMDV
jgi:hypothetical protein